MTDPFTSDGAKTPPKPFTAEEGHRKVRSFVLRQGRFTPAQQRAFDELWPRYGLDYTGRGRATSTPPSAAAPARAGNRLRQRRGPALRRAAGPAIATSSASRCMRLASAACSTHWPRTTRATCALYHHDAVEVLEHEIADGSLDEVRIYFPDPWHKKRHNKRRLVQPGLRRIAGAQAGRRRALAPRHRLARLCRADVGRARCHAGPAQSRRPARAMSRGRAWRPQTHFETRGQKLGHGVWDLLYDRC